MKKSNPWDVLPREPYGDETEDALYLAVGKALTAWEELDNEQGSLFAVIVLSQDSAANAAYGSVASGPGRGSMVIAAADQIFGNFDPVLLKEITSLVNLVGRLLGRRNDIAHGIVQGFAFYDGRPRKGFLGYYLVPPNYNTRKRLDAEALQKRINTLPRVGGIIPGDIMMFSHLSYVYTAAQIDYYREQFKLARQQMAALWRKTEARHNQLVKQRKEHLERVFGRMREGPGTKG
jgi:hypothetical protein